MPELRYAYYKIGIDSDSEEVMHNDDHMSHYRRRVTQVGDCDAIRNLLWAMNRISTAMMAMECLISRNPILIYSLTYMLDVEALCNVLRCLQHQYFCWHESMWEFVSKYVARPE